MARRLDPADSYPDWLTMNLYRPLLRPASWCTLPAGIEWEYVEMPFDSTMRQDLPRSRFWHGIIRTSRPLTADELRHFDLEKID